MLDPFPQVMSDLLMAMQYGRRFPFNYAASGWNRDDQPIGFDERKGTSDGGTPDAKIPT
ncbi:hypothetical protein Plo01_62470 [Planobispora longispora]|uniref:Uncharacterized protein n=1 Tax=Planobispora longispora TaxID=28887 RepID=A0A8J3W8L7_9ACTN|nr:hypothetical protein GCM10020093_011460 [Planobispora longispora]GIH79818.1 hypothetical protein Plo01_62470 [Planobispora longispora]